MVYATRRDLYTYGLRRGVLSNEGRLVASVAASTDLLELDNHLLETDDPVLLRAVEGGTLSAPLVEGTTYYAIRVSDSTFKLSATAGGAAINLTSDGVSMIVTAPIDIDALLEAYSRFVDDFMPHGVPMTEPYPVTVVRVVCELTAAKLLNMSGQASQSMKDAEISAKAQLERWLKGLPIRDASASASSNLAVRVASTSATDPSGWRSGTIP